jgi:hypothetical protein
MLQIPVFSVIAHRSDLMEEPGFRNDGALLFGDDEIQITTTWWNWARHMAWPLGLITSDLSMVFAGPSRTREVVLTMRLDKIASVAMRPDASPRPRAEVVGTREEDGETWLCSFAYDEEYAPHIHWLESHISAEQTAVETPGPR